MGGRAFPLVVDLPMPSSVNQIWRQRRAKAGKPHVYSSPQYKAWVNECDALCMANRWHKLGVRSGKYRVAITLNSSMRRGDCDNRIKPILDWLSRAGLTPDDRHCDAASVEWGTAPSGCRVIVQPAASSGEPRCCNGLSMAECARVPSRHCDGYVHAEDT